MTNSNEITNKKGYVWLMSHGQWKRIDSPFDWNKIYEGYTDQYSLINEENLDHFISRYFPFLDISFPECSSVHVYEYEHDEEELAAAQNDTERQWVYMIYAGVKFFSTSAFAQTYPDMLQVVSLFASIVGSKSVNSNP